MSVEHHSPERAEGGVGFKSHQGTGTRRVSSSAQLAPDRDEFPLSPNKPASVDECRGGQRSGTDIICVQ